MRKKTVGGKKPLDVTLAQGLPCRFKWYNLSLKISSTHDGIKLLDSLYNKKISLSTV
jgi:hypothetical protein